MPHGSLAALAFLIATTGAIALDIDPAMPVLRMYTTAVAADDCDLVWQLTSNAVKRRDKSGEFHETTCRFLHGANYTEELGQPIAHLRDGRLHAVFVPSKRRSQAFNFAPVTELMYIVHSQDDGATWEVLDLGCVDERWVREVFPAYRGEPHLATDRAKAFAFLQW